MTPFEIVMEAPEGSVIDVIIDNGREFIILTSPRHESEHVDRRVSVGAGGTLGYIYRFNNGGLVLDIIHENQGNRVAESRCIHSIDPDYNKR